MSWEPIPHACRFCGGRLEQEGQAFRCITCEASATGKVESLCGCGMHFGRQATSEKQRARQKARPAQEFACMPNPGKCELSPAVYLIGLGGEPIRRGAVP